MVPPVAWTFERHLDEVGHYAVPPGAILRTQFPPDQPPYPPPGVFARAPGHKIDVRTRYWEVEAACVSPG